MIEKYICIAVAWSVLGALGWGWANHCAYKDNPEADKNPKKWSLLPLMIGYGPFALLFTLIIGLVDRNLSFGLRFK